ncbi:TPA: LacI family DNA-binding transcriptional regulator [Escherichia coli]|nr:LacI family DNA-binding transcriptional regulator [Escherichia coli]MBF9736448.1 LacI family DNA-binding transcriptional regulator [Escherichia coli]MBK0857606.1 LacI family DNA-binding transcriptional regulator [Escherichia coli]MCD2267893.1 LacI family DNA-binding transcriptional regulator [Escherichia coli]MDC3669934.1 LacI family DNA-binding transcriptional regulator [Escherichia coli]
MDLASDVCFCYSARFTANGLGMASLKDVARLAGVSMMTVSRVMHNAESVRPATRDRVLQAIQTLNYVPDLSARKMRAQGRKPSTLAVLAQDTATTPFSVDILLAIEQTASEFGWNSFLINIFSEDDAARAARQLLAHRPDGIIYTTMGLRHITLPESLYGENIVLANCVADDPALPSYIPDDYTAQYESTQHLLAAGYRQPLCFWLPESALATGYRRQGFEQAWRDAGRDLAEVKQFHMATGDDHYTDLASLLNDHFKSCKPDFDVLICGNDRAAFVAYQVLLAKGVRIPKDVAVMGFDNLVGVGHLFLPPLTTIQLPHDIIGREAALHIIEGREGGRVTRIPCPLLIRCST